MRCKCIWSLYRPPLYIITFAKTVTCTCVWSLYRPKLCIITFTRTVPFRSIRSLIMLPETDYNYIYQNCAMCVYMRFVLSEIGYNYLYQNWVMDVYLIFVSSKTTDHLTCWSPDVNSGVVSAMHYVAWASWRLKSSTPRLFVQQLVQSNYKGSTKCPHNWHFVRGIHKCMLASHAVVRQKHHKYQITELLFRKTFTFFQRSLI